MDLQVGVKIILKNKEGKFLVLLRSAEKYPQMGAQWDIVGGRINIGTPLIDNLKREVLEETGLEIIGEPKLLTAQDILKTDKHVVRLTYVGTALGEVVLSDEHSEYRWVFREELENLEPMDSYFKKVLSSFDLN